MSNRAEWRNSRDWIARQIARAEDGAPGALSRSQQLGLAIAMVVFLVYVFIRLS
jgi:hypothetical protein